MWLLRFVPKKTKIDFVGVRWVGFIFTIATVLATIASLYLQGLNLGIDFTGGVLVEVRKEDGAIDISQMRETVGGLGFGEVAIQSYAGGELCAAQADSCVLIRVMPEGGISGKEQETVTKIREALGAGYAFDRVEAVGPKVSDELFNDGVIATILAVLMIAVYVAFRFEWQFGIAAVIATGHDVFVTLGLFTLLQMDFNLTSVAALLTLAGYSINDTVVVFDRIRENRRKYKKMPLSEIINLSTNETLSRTIMTSLTTAIAIIPIVFLGGPALFGFSVAILFGIVIGTYSSIYVAAAILLYLPPISGMTPDEDAAARAAARP